MRSTSPSPVESAPSPAPSGRGILFALLLVALFPVVLWALSEPVLAAAVLAGAVGTVAAQIGLASAASRLKPGDRRRVCIPATGVCVEF